jgi:uncharacterized membrane protein YhaH (DUF805 family)
MTFTESIKTCLSKFADFNGRASRSEYWWYVLFIVLTGAVLSAINRNLAALFYLVTLLPSIAAAARRLHDTNRSGWIIMIFLLIQGPKDPNRYG